MAQAGNSELVDAFEQFFRNYYDNDVKQLAQRYPNEQRSLYVDWQDLYRYDPDLADDYINQPEQLQQYAEEALRLYDLPVDVSLGQAHVRVRNLPGTESPEIREIRARHMNTLVEVRGIVRKATDVRPKIEEAAFECQLCGTLTRVPQSTGDFQEPHECQGCERQGPFRVNFDQSEFVDAQKLRVQESPEGLRGGETPQALDVNVEDDITGEVTPGDHVSATGVLRLEQQTNQQEKSPIFDFYMEGVSVDVEEEQFEDMDITEEDKTEIVRLSEADDIYDQMVASIAPSIYGYDQEKLAMILQLFSGVTKQLPDGSRIRGDLHMLLIGDPGTGKCLSGDTKVSLADGREKPIRELVEANLEDPKPIDDGWYDEVDLEVPSLQQDGSIGTRRATKVWKREAPDRMYRIRTESGRELEVTPSHPLFVWTNDEFDAVRADELSEGDEVATATESKRPLERAVAADGGIAVAADTDAIVAIETVDPSDDWVYDLEVAGTHNYVSNGVISHNSQMLSYIQNIAPRSVYTSGKGSSSAGLTAAAVRDDFGDGQQWTLEAGALVLADQGVAAVDELDKMRCVTGDARVRMADGTSRQIADIVASFEAEGVEEPLENGRTIRGGDAVVRSMDGDGSLVDRPVTAVHEYEPPAELVEVVIAGGDRVRSTLDHPFFVETDDGIVERPAAALEVGDETLGPRRSDQRVTDGGTDVETESSGQPQRGVRSRPIVDVRRVDNEDEERVYDLTVEGTHNFVANGVVVHNSEDRSAMHQALEQQEISVSKAGINATLKSRCSLLGAANPKYGRFDQYEPIGEQIDLEPALISRFDLIFTVTDQPDEEKDRNLAEHIINSNYAGELTTQREQMTSVDVGQDEIDAMTETVDPEIDADLLRKYVAYAKQNCHPRMTEEAREAIRDFYVDLRSKGTDEDAPVPVTARKLEALVRLSEASARVRLADTVELADAERVIEIVRSCLQDIGVDPETGEFDADIVEAGTSKSQRDRIKNLKQLIGDVEEEYDEGAPVDVVLERADEIGMDRSKAEHEIDKLKQKGEVYEPSTDTLRTT